jgi:hypothetical protein
MHQITHFHASHFTNAAAVHEQMAQLQAKAGNHRLAADSRESASSRRIAAANVSDAVTTKDALDFGDFGAKALRSGIM